MTNREKYLDKTLKETLEAFSKESDNLDILSWLIKDADASTDEPKSKTGTPSSFASDLGAKLGLAALPITSMLAAGGKVPNVNVWVFCGK